MALYPQRSLHAVWTQRIRRRGAPHGRQRHPPSHRIHRWTRRLLPRGRRPDQSDIAAAARLSVQLTHVPQPDQLAGRRIPPGGPRPHRVRPLGDADDDPVHLQLRPSHRNHRETDRSPRPRPVRPLHPRLRRADRPTHRQPAPRTDHRADHPERQRLHWRASPRSGTSCSRTPRTGPPTKTGCAKSSPRDHQAGSTPTACPPTGWTASRPRPGCSTSSGWTARTTTPSSCSCSGTTSSTSTAIPRSRSTSAPISRRCWSPGARTTRSSAPPGAEAFRRDFPNGEFHLLDAGHFALETHGEEISGYIRGFLGRQGAAR